MKKIIIFLSFLLAVTVSAQSRISAPLTDSTLVDSTTLVLKQENRTYSVRLDSIRDFLKNYFDGIYIGGGSQNLQQVTDLGSTTNNNITLSTNGFGFITAEHTGLNRSSYLGTAGTLGVIDGNSTHSADLISTDVLGPIFRLRKNNFNVKLWVDNPLSNIDLELPATSGRLALYSELAASSFDEWASSTGTRAGGDLELLLGEWNADNNGTSIGLFDATGQIFIGETLTGNGFDIQTQIGTAVLKHTLQIKPASASESGKFIIENPADDDTEIDNYSFETINGNGIFKANGGTNGSVVPLLTFNSSTLRTGLGNYELPRNDGADGQVFKTDGNGDVQWSDVDASDVTYNNSGTDLTSNNIQDVTNELNTKINNLSGTDFEVVTDSTYTITESSAGKIINLKNYRIDGVTPPDTTVITYSNGINPNGKQLVYAFSNISGSAVKLLPDTNVVDYRSNTKKQYILPSGTQGLQTITSIAQDSIWTLSSGWTVIDYTPPSTSNIILNGTFDDTSNITYDDPPFSVAGGVASLSSNVGNFTFDLSEDMLANTSYTFGLDISNGTGTSRFRLFVNQGGSFVEVVSNTTYSDGTISIPLTTPAGADSTQIRITTSSTATSFDFDNVTLIQD